MTQTPKFWWPLPEELDDLTVTETDEGFSLDAPSDTGCGLWLAYWNRTETHRKVFHQHFTDALISHANFIIDGQTEAIPERTINDSVQAEEDTAGELT